MVTFTTNITNTYSVRERNESNALLKLRKLQAYSVKVQIRAVVLRCRRGYWQWFIVGSATVEKYAG